VLSASPTPVFVRFGAVAVIGLLLGGALAACNTTQQTAARLKIRSKRLLADNRPVEVRTTAAGVEVLGTTLLHDPGRTAVAVALRNSGSEPVNDLPLSIGLREGGGKVVELNHNPSTYFQAHAPALAPGERGTWVFTGKEKVPVGDTVIARVGIAPKPPVTTAADVPTLDVEHVATSPSRKGAKVKAEISNPTSLPQYNVAVYAWAKRGGRYVAAGQASVDEVNAGDTETVSVRLIGDPGKAKVHVFAPATIFE
jgi:hypothetical protein